MCQIGGGRAYSGQRSNRGHCERWCTVFTEHVQRTGSAPAKQIVVITVRRRPSHRVGERAIRRLQRRREAVTGLRQPENRANQTAAPPRGASSGTREIAHPHLSVVAGNPPQRLIESLTGREEEVLEQLAQARTNAEIAECLHISRRTVETHLNSIYGKLGVRTRLEALRYAIERDMMRDIEDRRDDGHGGGTTRANLQYVDAPAGI